MGRERGGGEGCLHSLVVELYFFLKKRGHSVLACLWERRTFMPSSEKHGGTAELSSSASESKIGNFSTADMGMSPL